MFTNKLLVHDSYKSLKRMTTNSSEIIPNLHECFNLPFLELSAQNASFRIQVSVIVKFHETQCNVIFTSWITYIGKNTTCLSRGSSTV